MARQIKGDPVIIERPVNSIYLFLSDFTNFSPLMPEQVSNWQATSEQCTFEIQGLISMGMRITERVTDQRIVMTGEGKIPFSFTLSCLFQPLTGNSTSTQLIIDADLNPFMAMMAEKPLADFIASLSRRLKVEMENQKS